MISETELTFEKTELKDLQKILKSNDIPYKLVRKSNLDHDMTLRLSKHLMLFFYKKVINTNKTIKMYSVGLVANDYNVNYLLSYSENLEKVIKTIKDNIHKRHITYENKKGENRHINIIIRETEEILNEMGIETNGSFFYRIKLMNGMKIIIDEHKGLCNFKIEDLHQHRWPQNGTTDLIEIKRILKKMDTWQYIG